MESCQLMKRKEQMVRVAVWRLLGCFRLLCGGGQAVLCYACLRSNRQGCDVGALGQCYYT